MEDELNFGNKWKMTLIFNTTGKRPQYLTHTKDDLNFFHQRKTSSFKQQLKSNSNFINNLEDLSNNLIDLSILGMNLNNLINK